MSTPDSSGKNQNPFGTPSVQQNGTDNSSASGNIAVTNASSDESVSTVSSVLPDKSTSPDVSPAPATGVGSDRAGIGAQAQGVVPEETSRSSTSPGTPINAVPQGSVSSNGVSPTGLSPVAAPPDSSSVDTLPVSASTQTIPNTVGGMTDNPIPQSNGNGGLPPISDTPPADLGNKDEKEEDDEKDEPQVVERVIIKEKGGGLGCFGLIKRITCFILLIFLLLVTAVVALIIFKPPFLTEPLKMYLNGNYKPDKTSEGITSISVESYIDEVTSPTNGEVTFQLTEDQLTTLVRARLADGADVRVGLEEEKIQIFVDVAEQGEPLWVIVELTDTEDKLVFSRIGFGKINTPESLREFVKERAFGLMGTVIKDLELGTSEQLISSLAGGEISSSVVIKDVKFAKDLVLVTVEL
ncbi:hypothetical protein JW796_02265 [Candidatus Dojkabacteria bacterium]|nr:hypothetical protein [Candidatus Dojkabacteria bacterium]